MEKGFYSVSSLLRFHQVMQPLTQQTTTNKITNQKVGLRLQFCMEGG